MRQVLSCSTGISSPGMMAASGIFGGGPTTHIFSSAFLWETPSRSLSLLRHFGSGLECGSRQPPSLRLVVSPLLALFHQSVRAAGNPLCCSGFSPSPPGSDGGRLFGQLHGPGLPPEAGGHSLVVSECGGSRTSSALRVSVGSPSASVHSWPSECSCGFAQLPLSGPWLRMDVMSSGFRGASASVARHHRPLRDVYDTSSSFVLLADVRPDVCRHRCDVAVLGRSAGLCLPSLQPSSSGVGEGLGFQRPGADVGGSLLASAPLVPGPSGAAPGDPLFLPRRRDLLRQPHFHHFHQNLSVLQLTAFRISGDPRVRPDSLTRWLVSLPTADAAPPMSTTKPSG